MKNVLIALCVVVGSLVTVGAFAQTAAQGSEEPAVYGEEKSRVMAQEKRLRQSQVIEDVAQTYREMVAAYKAKRIVRAEEMSRKLMTLTQDPILPEAFAKKMQRKQEKFLKRIYGNDAASLVDVPEEAVSTEEVKEIQEAVGVVIKDVPSVVPDTAAPDAEVTDPYAERTAERKALRVKRLEEKRRRSDERAARAQERRQRREAARQMKSEQRQARLAEKKSGKETAEKIAAAPEQASRSIEEEIAKIREAERQLVMEKRLVEFQKAAEEPEAAEGEIERYARLYQEGQAKEKELLQEELAKKVEGLYQDGIEFYHQRAYRFSLDVLTEVEKLSPDYKETRAYLAELKKDFRLQRVNTTRPPLRDPQRQQVISNTLDSYLP